MLENVFCGFDVVTGNVKLIVHSRENIYLEKFRI